MPVIFKIVLRSRVAMTKISEITGLNWSQTNPLVASSHGANTTHFGTIDPSNGVQTPQQVAGHNMPMASPPVDQHSSGTKLANLKTQPTSPQDLVSQFLVDVDNTQVQQKLMACIEANPQAFKQLGDIIPGALPSLPLIYDLHQAASYSNSFKDGLQNFKALELTENDFYFGQASLQQVFFDKPVAKAQSSTTKYPLLDKLKQFFMSQSQDTISNQQSLTQVSYKPQGLGVRVFPNGIKHIGGFDTQGKLQGEGVVVNAKGYLKCIFIDGQAGGPRTGESDNASKEGGAKGSFYFYNKDTFSGNYSGGLAFGMATYKCATGLEVRGTFFMGALQKEPPPEYIYPKAHLTSNKDLETQLAKQSVLDGSEWGIGQANPELKLTFERLVSNPQPLKNYIFRETADGFINVASVEKKQGQIIATFEPHLKAVQQTPYADSFSVSMDMPGVTIGSNAKKK